jgi:hypothetical protein
MSNVSNGVVGTTLTITNLISDTHNIATTVAQTTAPGFLYHTNQTIKRYSNGLKY